MLNKSYKGLILCLTGLSDKYKCQKATRINNNHLQTNKSKYNLKPKTKYGVKRWEMFSLGLYQVFPTQGNKRTGSQLFSAARTLTRSSKPGTSGQLCFSHTFVWIFPVMHDQHLKSFQILSEKNQPAFLYCEANCKIVTRLCAI